MVRDTLFEWESAGEPHSLVADPLIGGYVEFDWALARIWLAILWLVTRYYKFSNNIPNHFSGIFVEQNVRNRTANSPFPAVRAAEIIEQNRFPP
jgi:hypothetical protein